MRVWLAKDPETERITASETEFDEGNLPRGRRGQGWEIRVADNVHSGDWDDVMAARVKGDVVDALHRLWWAGAE